MQTQWTTGSTTTITGDRDVASATPTSLPDAQGDCQPHPACNNGATQLPVRVDKYAAMCPDDSCASKRSRTVKVAYRQPSKGKVTDLVIDSTGLKALGEGEWKARKHGAESGANCIWPLTQQPTISWRRKSL